MKRKLLAVVTAFAIAGCASINKQPIAVSTVADLKAKTIAHTKREAPAFASMTPGKMLFAIVGGALAISEGKSIVDANNLKDPSEAIASELMDAISTAHGAKSSSQPVVVSDDSATKISAAGKGTTPYIIDVETIHWGIMYFPKEKSRYRVMYTAKARLINTVTESIVAEGFCASIPEDPANAPTYDELLDHEAIRLKQELSSATSKCVNSFKREMLLL